MNIKREKIKRNEIKASIFDNLTGKKNKSIKFIYIFMIMTFLFFLIITIFYTNYIVMSYLYKNVNNFYLSGFVIQPVSDVNSNFTQTLRMRIKTQQQIVLESRAYNLGALTDFVFQNDIRTLPDYQITTNLGLNSNSTSENLLNDTFINLNTTNLSISPTIIQQKFLILSQFLEFMKQNSDSPFEIDEIMILDSKNMNYLTSCVNFNEQMQFIPNIFVSSYLWPETEKNLDSYNFLDYIVENIYSEDLNYFNYIKIFRQKTTINGEELTFFIFLRLNYAQIINIFDIFGNNMTIVFQYESFIKNRRNLNFLPISNYLTLFFENAVRYYINPYQSLASTLLSRTINQLENYNLTDLSNYFNIMNNYNFWNSTFDKNYINYNLNFYNEFVTMGGTLYKTLKTYFGFTDIREMLGLVDTNFSIGSYSNTTTLTYDTCIKNVNITYSPILCEIVKFDENFQLQNLSISGSNANNDTNIPSIIQQSLQIWLNTSFNNPLYYKQSDIFVGSGSSSYTKKFLIYLSTINNLQVVSINMVNFEQYYDIEDIFVTNLSYYSKIVTVLLIFFCLVVFFVSFVITNRSANSLKSRLTLLKDVRSTIFYNDMSIANVLCDNFEHDYVAIENLVKRAIDKTIEEKEKIEIIEDDKFTEMLSILIVESKMRFKSLLDKIDRGKKYIKIIYIRRRFCIYEQDENFPKKI